jgi:hypothetical protein
VQCATATAAFLAIVGTTFFGIANTGGLMCVETKSMRHAPVVGMLSTSSVQPVKALTKRVKVPSQ